MVEDSSGESNQSMGSLEWLPSHHTSWLSKSRQGGLDALLEVRPKPGRPTAITGKIRQQLVRVLKIQKGSAATPGSSRVVASGGGVSVAYKTVHTRSALSPPSPTPVASSGFRKTIPGRGRGIQKNAGDIIHSCLSETQRRQYGVQISYALCRRKSGGFVECATS